MTISTVIMTFPRNKIGFRLDFLKLDRMLNIWFDITNSVLLLGDTNLDMETPPCLFKD